MKKILLSVVFILAIVAGYFVFINKGSKPLLEQESVNKTEEHVDDSKTVSVGVAVSTSTQVRGMTTPKPISPVVVETKPVETKNIYTNSQGKYSIGLPVGWVAKDAGAQDPFISTDFIDASGKFTNSDVAFSVSVTPRKINEDSFVNAGQTKPATQKMTDEFIRGREDSDENWSTVGTTKTTLSGYETYVITVKYAGDYATSKVYLVYTPNNIYNITRMIVNSKLTQIESQLSKSVLSFKVF